MPRSSDRTEFLDRIGAHVTKEALEDPEAAVRAVFGLPRRRSFAGEIEDIAHAMYKSSREIWKMSNHRAGIGGM